MKYGKWAAYGGEGWQPRFSAHPDDVRGNLIWRQCGENSEWARLREVALYVPRTDWDLPTDVNSVQFLERVDVKLLRSQLGAFVRILEDHGIIVHMIDDGPFDALDGKGRSPLVNLLYASDLGLTTSEGVVVGRMGSSVRAGEEKYLARLVARLGMPILATISGQATFEASDAMWIAPDLVFVGVGNRTNSEGFRQLRSILKPLGVATHAIRLPGHSQHLQGILRIIDRKTALVRGEFAPHDLKRHLRQRGFSIVELPETPAVTFGQIMNFIVVDEAKIITCQSDAAIDRKYTDAGLEICHVADVSELLKGAGGLACATATLRRDLVAPL